MKKGLLLLVYIIISNSAFCQLWKLEGKQTSNDKIRFGVKAGITVATCPVEYSSTAIVIGYPKYKLGVMGGVFAGILLSKKVCFQPELLIVGKGMKEDNQSYGVRTDLTYLELPLNLLYKPTNPKGSFFVGGGPAPAIYIGENVFYSGPQYFKKFDFGINILAGYELPIGFSINLHYTHGLINISDNKTDLPLTKNRCFGLSVGYS
ncbi:MAG: porin family protein, partial [Chitinophagaceae bacterium]